MLAALVLVAATVAACERAAGPSPQPRIPPELGTRHFPPPGWTWGRLETSDGPAVRYGVGTPPRASRGAVLILPGFAEPAEVWFETATELIEEDYTVWLLDLAGQGGSGRWSSRRDRAHLPSMAVNVSALRTAVDEVIRPSPAPPLLLFGSDLGAQVAVLGMSEGLTGVSGVILSDPSLSALPSGLRESPPPLWMARLASRVGLGGRYALGQGGWSVAASRDAPAGSRAAAPQAWMRANPELRTGGVTWGWLNAYADSVRAARSPQTLGRIGTSVLMLDGGAPEAKAVCGRLADCRYVELDDASSPHLGEDPARDAWRREVTAFLDAHARDYAIAAPVRTAISP